MMRNLILCAILLGAPCVALAEADGPDYFAVSGVRAGSVLNIRSVPDVTSRKIGAIPSDETGLKNLGCKGGLTFAEWEQTNPAEREAANRTRWCNIEWNGVTGWVAGWYLREDTTPADPQ